jgi:hypothetical protein
LPDRHSHYQEIEFLNNVLLQVYFTAWLLDLVVPLCLATIIVLIVYPRSRHYLFPSVPLAAVSATTGAVQTPRAGELGSKDSLTGADETFKGEAAEQEASGFVSGLTTLAVSSTTGASAPGAEKHPERPKDEEPEAIDNVIPHPADVTSAAVEAQEKAGGNAATTPHGKTSVEAAMWEKAGPTMHVLSEIADTWEMFGK